MIDRKISVHLQNFPNLYFLNDEKELMADMDLVRAVCSTALALRDSKNLRVRLPLSELVVIGKDAQKILGYKDIIADEVNVKNIITKDNILEVAELKLQINFKKIGAKYGSKIKEITELTKSGKWTKISDNEIEIPTSQSPTRLIGDEFEIKLTAKNQDDKKYLTLPLPSNDYLIQLNIETSKELEQEGIARDVVRMIQQYRKDADLNVSDHIKINLNCKNSDITNAIAAFISYIKDQTLTDELNISNDDFSAASQFSFVGNIDDAALTIAFSVT